MWWYARPDRASVINGYINRYSKGRAVPDGFRETIVQTLGDLSRIHNKAEWGQPRTKRYWSIPAYALAHKMKRATLMKWLRELEAVAKEQFPDSVPSSRKRRALTEEDKQKIRQRYLAGEDCKNLAEEFRITAGHVGLICCDEKEQRDKERLRLMDSHFPVTRAPESGDPDTPI
jgi:hypothetical protein